jgi:hypothetical protein
VEYQSVIVYELAGDRSRALYFLEAALKAGYSFKEVSLEPELGRLREDGRYLEMVQRLDLH